MLEFDCFSFLGVDCFPDCFALLLSSGLASIGDPLSASGDPAAPSFVGVDPAESFRLILSSLGEPAEFLAGDPAALVLLDSDLAADGTSTVGRIGCGECPMAAACAAAVESLSSED